MDPAEAIFANVHGGARDGPGTARDDDSADHDMVDDDASAFSSQPCADITETNIYNRYGLCPGSDDGADATVETSQVEGVPAEINAAETKIEKFSVMAA